MRLPTRRLWQRVVFSVDECGAGCIVPCCEDYYAAARACVMALGEKKYGSVDA